MGAVAEAKVVITGSDHTGEAFQSVARKVEQLGKTTKKVGEAAASIGKVAGEVDKISGSVGRANAAVERMSGALRTMDGGAASIGRVAAAVDKAAGTMPRLTADAANMAKAMAGVTAAEKALAAETERVSKAGSKLTLFKELQGDFKGARATFDAARSGLASLAKQMDENEMRATALRQRRDIALAAEARARAAYEANPIPKGKDAADKARFDAMKAARATAAGVMVAAEKERRAIEADLHVAERGERTRKLARDYGDAQKATALASSALEAQRSALKGVKAEFEGLAGPLISVSGAEKRLVADAEAATRAFEEQGAAATRAGEATVRAITREEEARARQMATSERWMRQYRALEGRAGAQAGALAPRGGLTAVETLAAARRRPAAERHDSALAREASDLARARMDLAAFREVQTTTAELRRAAREAQAEAARVGRDVKAARNPSPELLADHARVGEAASSATAAFERQAGVLKGLKADIEGVIGPMHSLASAEAQIAQRADAADGMLKRQQARHKRLHAAREMAEDILPFEGPEVLHLTREAAHEGAMLQHERVGLQNAGRTPEEIKEIEERSLHVAGALPTATMEENMKVVAETTPAFGSLDHALEHLQFMQKTMAVLKAAGGEHIKGGVGDVGRDFAKFFEDRLTKPEEFEGQAARMIPAMVASGGVFNPHEMMMFGQQAHSALAGFDTDFIADYAPSMVLAHGGAKAGTAASAYANVIMGKANDKKQAEMWNKLGLLDMSKAITKNGAAVSWTAGAIKNTDLALQNPVRWAEEVAIPAMKAHGYDTSNRIEVQKVLATMFRNLMANQFANDIMQPASLARMHKDAGIYSRVGKLDDAYHRDLHEDVTFALPALGETLKSFASIVTSPAMKDAADMIGSTAEQLAHLGEAVGKWNEAHPQAAKAIAGGALTGGLAVGGILTGMLFTNLKSLLSGGASTAAAAEMAAAGGMQIRAGEMMLAAAGKGAVPGGVPGGGLPGGEPGAKPGSSPGYAKLGFRAFLAAIGLGSVAAGAPDPSTPEGQKAMDANDKRIADFNKAASDATGGFFPAEGGDPGADLAQRGRELAKSLWGRIFGNDAPAAAPALPSFADMPLPPVRPADLAPLSAPAQPAVVAVPLSALPAGALPPASAVSSEPVPVHVVSTAANIPAGPLGPGLHRDFTLGNRTGDFSDPGMGMGSGFSPFPGRRAPPMDAVQAHAVPLGAGPVPGLESLAAQLSSLKATIDGPVTAQVSGNAEVSVSVKVEAGSSLIQAAAAASQGKASMPLSSGNGSSGGTGVQRTPAAPGTGATWGAGHR